MSQSTVCILSLMLLVTSEGRGVLQSWKSVDICEDGTLHEQMIVARDPFHLVQHSVPRSIPIITRHRAGVPLCPYSFVIVFFCYRILLLSYSFVLAFFCYDSVTPLQVLQLLHSTLHSRHTQVFLCNPNLLFSYHCYTTDALKTQ